MTVVHEMTERPPGFVAPNLSPTGLTLQPQEVGDGVYALMANQLPKDNNGLIVGEDAALVVDAGVTPEVGRHIQEVAAGLTDKPIRYLANTTYHGDHTFGNAAFGPEVTIFPRVPTKPLCPIWTVRSWRGRRACTATSVSWTASAPGASRT